MNYLRVQKATVLQGERFAPPAAASPTAQSSFHSEEGVDEHAQYVSGSARQIRSPTGT
jgi:hypothetical protein